MLVNPGVSTASPLIVVTRAPYDGALARSALDVAMSFAVFGQQPKLLFSGAGALCLVQREPAEALGRKSLRKVIDSLPLYDVEEVFVEAIALGAYGITVEEIPVFASPVDGPSIKQLQESRSRIVSF